MKSIRYYLWLVATSASTKRLMKETKGLGQRDLKVSTRDCFLFNSWFLSKTAAEAAVSIGVNLIDIVKTNTQLFFKAKI